MSTYKINGRSVSEAEWDKSTEDGTYQIYYYNGQLESEHTQNDKLHGLLHGLYRTWYINGQLQREYNYRNDKGHGFCREWYPNGQLKGEYNYQNGKRYGLCRSWNEDGSLGYGEIYINDINRTEEFKHNQLAQVVVFGRVIL